jgi:hypothetical protein
MNSIPLPVWTHGTDPDGMEFYSCPDPTDPAMRVTVTSTTKNFWRLDHVGVKEWWWDRMRRHVLSSTSTAEEGKQQAVLFLYGQRLGEWLNGTQVSQEKCPLQVW